jgi:hypothetical protein
MHTLKKLNTDIIDAQFCPGMAPHTGLELGGMVNVYSWLLTAIHSNQFEPILLPRTGLELRPVSMCALNCLQMGG